MRVLRFGFRLGPFVAAVLAVVAVYIPLAIITGKNAAVLWHLFYLYCGLTVIGCVAVWVHNYHRAGGHLKNKAWQFYRALKDFAEEHPQPIAILAGERDEAEAAWVRISGQYAKSLVPRAYELRDELKAHGWDSAPWWHGALTHPNSVCDIRTEAEQLRSAILRMP